MYGSFQSRVKQNTGHPSPMPTPPDNAAHFMCSACGGYVCFCEAGDAVAMLAKPIRCRRDNVSCPPRGPVEAWTRQKFLGTCREQAA